MPRALWSGTITFGLVNVPIRLFPAVREHTLHFHLVHEPDGGAIGYQKVCKKEGEPVPDDEIVKAYEVGKGEVVPLTDEDFESVRAEGVRDDRDHGVRPGGGDRPALLRALHVRGRRLRGREGVLAARAGDGGRRASPGSRSSCSARSSTSAACACARVCSCSSSCTSRTRSGRSTRCGRNR